MAELSQNPALIGQAKVSAARALDVFLCDYSLLEYIRILPPEVTQDLIAFIQGTRITHKTRAPLFRPFDNQLKIES
jgi:hypothetical protein